MEEKRKKSLNHNSTTMLKGNHEVTQPQKKLSGENVSASSEESSIKNSAIPDSITRGKETLSEKKNTQRLDEPSFQREKETGAAKKNIGNEQTLESKLSESVEVMPKEKSTAPTTEVFNKNLGQLNEFFKKIKASMDSEKKIL